MSFRTSILASVDAARAVTQALGVRTNQLTVRTRTWSGARLKMGTYTDSDLVLPARYKIKPITAGQVYSSGGQYEIGDILVDHLTPSNGAGTGYTVEQLAPTVTTDNVEIIYVITGEHPGEYARVEMRSYRPFTYQMILRHRFP